MRQWEFPNTNKNRSNAKELCEKRGLELVSINSKEEMSHIKPLIKAAIDKGFPVITVDSFFWIGLKRDAPDQWIFDDGSDFSFKPWATNDNKDGKENCVVIQNQLYHDVLSWIMFDWLAASQAKHSLGLCNGKISASWKQT